MSYWEVLKTVLEKKSIFLIFLIAFLYLTLAAYIMNYRLVLNTISGDFPLSYKFSILSSLFLGLKSALSAFDFYLLLLTSLLFGFNLILILKTIEMIKSSSHRAKLILGGGSILTIASAGCTTCGLSLISVLGAGASLTFLRFEGKFIYLFSISLLVLSIIYMLKKLQTVCKIPTEK